MLKTLTLALETLKTVDLETYQFSEVTIHTPTARMKTPYNGKDPRVTKCRLFGPSVSNSISKTKTTYHKSVALSSATEFVPGLTRLAIFWVAAVALKTCS